jgi:hypothetical protein
MGTGQPTLRLRCSPSLYSLVEGVRGHVVWRHPPIARDLVALLEGVTGIRIELPGQTAPGQDSQEVAS